MAGNSQFARWAANNKGPACRRRAGDRNGAAETEFEFEIGEVERIADGEAVEMGETRPRRVRDCPTRRRRGSARFSGRRFFGKRGRQVGAADMRLLPPPGTHFAHERAHTSLIQIRSGVADRLEDHGDPRTGRAVRARKLARGADGAGRDGVATRDFMVAEGSDQKFTMILPNTCRLSSRARPRSISASGTSMSITGARPISPSWRGLSRMLRSEAHERGPKILYCCWKQPASGRAWRSGPTSPAGHHGVPPRLSTKSEPGKVSASSVLETRRRRLFFAGSCA